MIHGNASDDEDVYDFLAPQAMGSLTFEFVRELEPFIFKAVDL